jgi:hypothetical protein
MNGVPCVWAFPQKWLAFPLFFCLAEKGIDKAENHLPLFTLLLLHIHAQ